MGVHKKPGMNTSGATVNCGLIFLWKESERDTCTASLSPGMRAPTADFLHKTDLQKIAVPDSRPGHVTIH